MNTTNKQSDRNTELPPLAESQIAFQWWEMKLTKEERGNLLMDWFGATNVSLDDKDILEIWRKETQVVELKPGMKVSHKYILQPMIIVEDEKGPAYTGEEFSDNEISLSFAKMEYSNGNLTILEPQPTTNTKESSTGHEVTSEGLKLFSILTTVDQFKLLKLGTLVYRVQGSQISKYYYAGINPKIEKGIMLVSGSNIRKIVGSYLGNRDIPYYLDYEMACKALLEAAQETVRRIQKIYIDKK